MKSRAESGGTAPGSCVMGKEPPLSCTGAGTVWLGCRKVSSAAGWLAGLLPRGNREGGLLGTARAAMVPCALGGRLSVLRDGARLPCSVVWLGSLCTSQSSPHSIYGVGGDSSALGCRAGVPSAGRSLRSWQFELLGAQETLGLARCSSNPSFPWGLVSSAGPAKLAP